jgi:hypothetical protein
LDRGFSRLTRERSRQLLSRGQRQLTLRDVHARLLPTVDMTSVLLGGSVVLSDIYALVDGIRNGPANLTNIVREVLPPYADIVDPVTGECNRLSGTIEMSARQAFAYQK